MCLAFIGSLLLVDSFGITRAWFIFAITISCRFSRASWRSGKFQGSRRIDAAFLALIMQNWLQSRKFILVAGNKMDARQLQLPVNT